MWINNLALHELTHFLVATVLGAGFFWKYRSLKLILVIFTVTFLIDLDHLFDYFYLTGNLKFWEYLGRMDFFIASNTVFVLAHSWELVFLLGIWGWKKRTTLILSISLAMAGHIIVDQFSYTSNPLAYFLIFRAANNFSLPWFDGL